MSNAFQAAMAIMALDDPKVREAVAACDPDTEGSLERALDDHGAMGPARDAIERAWTGRSGRPRYVPGWRP